MAKPPHGDEWSYELKWDGYRLAVHIETNGVRIITRGGHDWTHRFPGIEAAARRFMPNTMILDGEAVVLNEQGIPDFGRLQNSLGGRGGKLPAGNAILFAFDLLYLGGHDLTKMEYAARRQILEDVLADSQGGIRLSEEFHEDPDELLRHACAHELEGIIAKHRERPYRPGRTGDWLKIKCVQSDTFAIVGYEPSTALPGAIASLLLAARYRDGWKYVGSVGTGFKHDEARRLKKQRQDQDQCSGRECAGKEPGDDGSIIRGRDRVSDLDTYGHPPTSIIQRSARGRRLGGDLPAGGLVSPLNPRLGRDSNPVSLAKIAAPKAATAAMPITSSAVIILLTRRVSSIP